ncbi:MAG: pentapeptide repeat-containing protein [Rhodospirillaceae bacterium]|nr:pentapeptide repeat-containing protein [Rhodospirillaceae bacterium]
MSNPEHIDLARQGRDAWNAWRRRTAGTPADFSRVDFSAPEYAGISFAGFDFGDGADFSHCVFGTADHRAVAAQDISPYAPEAAPFIAGGAWFYGARFGDGATFANTTFRGVALFQSATFGRGACFVRAAFLDEADFVGARFGADASFAQAAFAMPLRFERASFRRGVSFEGGLLSDSRPLAPPGDTLPKSCFRHARFGGRASFAGRRFLDRADFAFADFAVPPDFAATSGRDRVDLQGARFRLHDGLVPGWTTRAATVADIRLLRSIARDASDDETARDLVVLERKAGRGIAWKNAREASWGAPLRKLGLFGRALATTALLLLYGLLADGGRSLLRPLAWLALVNYGAWLAYGELAKPSTTVVGRAARGTWGWIKSQFVSEPAATTSAPAGSLSAAQTKALFEFWWSSAVPGSVTRATYDKAVTILYGEAGIVPAVYAVQLGQVALNLGLLALLAMAVRNHFRRTPV